MVIGACLRCSMACGSQPCPNTRGAPSIPTALRCSTSMSRPIFPPDAQRAGPPRGSSADRLSERSLREIALAMGTDKEGAHSYADAYEWHFRHLRHRAITLLEIGVGGYRDSTSGGESLRMWKEFFPRAQIIGIDIHPKEGLSEDRIAILQGDQSDEKFLDDVASRYGPFDLVIDDGSHICAHVIASFRALFPHLAEDGIYAIEDLQTSYWARGYGGSSGLDRAGTSMTFLQELVDGLNYAEFDIPNYVPAYTDTWIRSLTFYHNMAFVQHRGLQRPATAPKACHGPGSCVRAGLHSLAGKSPAKMVSATGTQAAARRHDFYDPHGCARCPQSARPKSRSGPVEWRRRGVA